MLDFQEARMRLILQAIFNIQGQLHQVQLFCQLNNLCLFQTEG